MYYYSYDEFTADVAHFENLCGDYRPDIILAVARGGVTFGHFLAERFGIRALYTLNSIHYDDTQKLSTIEIFNVPHLPCGKNVLIVDDIVDSGETLHEIMTHLMRTYPQTTFKTGAIFYKKNAIFVPDFHLKEAHDWITFFWSQP